MDMLDVAIQATMAYVEHMPKSTRKKYGQFFTSKETAIFMTELFDTQNSRSSVSILDPGAGSGILSIALLAKLECIPRIKEIQLVCYENDPNVLDLLRSNLSLASKHSSKKVSFKIIAANYILSQVLDYNLNSTTDTKKYDFIIGNPPYMKIAKNSEEALAMPDVCYGTPNLYFLFATMSLFNLKEQGEMVYIIPRSWTSGAYFKLFRQKLLTDGALEHIHLFIKRDNIFEREDVLQETVIIKVRKTIIKNTTIKISTTHTNSDFTQKTEFIAPYNTIVAGSDNYVYLVTNSEELEILTKLNSWQDTLPDLGLKMKTGLTVDYRNRGLLKNSPSSDTVPLFYAQHIREGKVEFPIGKEYEYILTRQHSLLQNNTNYLFVKRFTAKEERRRLQCGIYLMREYPHYSVISTQNKLNYICGKNELSESMVYGLYVIFNSTLYDKYYRLLNGSTQVNSTEINSLPVPPLSIIKTMGEELICSGDMSENTCDNILRSHLHEKD